MSRIKTLAGEGLIALCEHLKEVRAAAGEVQSAATPLDDAESRLAVEIRGSIAELKAETESLTNAIIADSVTAGGS